MLARSLIMFLTLMLFAGPASADEEYTVKSKYPAGSSAADPDFQPGGYFNPYIIQKHDTDTGQTKTYEMKPRLPVDGHDPDMKPGGYFNPYKIEEK